MFRNCEVILSIMLVFSMLPKYWLRSVTATNETTEKQRLPEKCGEGDGGGGGGGEVSSPTSEVWNLWDLVCEPLKVKMTARCYLRLLAPIQLFYYENWQVWNITSPKITRAQQYSVITINSFMITNFLGKPTNQCQMWSHFVFKWCTLETNLADDYWYLEWFNHFVQMNTSDCLSIIMLCK